MLGPAHLIRACDLLRFDNGISTPLCAGLCNTPARRAPTPPHHVARPADDPVTCEQLPPGHSHELTRLLCARARYVSSGQWDQQLEQLQRLYRAKLDAFAHALQQVRRCPFRVWSNFLSGCMIAPPLLCVGAALREVAAVRAAARRVLCMV